MRHKISNFETLGCAWAQATHPSHYCFSISVSCSFLLILIFYCFVKDILVCLCQIVTSCYSWQVCCYLEDYFAIYVITYMNLSSVAPEVGGV
jgi:hypothetical protein